MYNDVKVNEPYYRKILHSSFHFNGNTFKDLIHRPKSLNIIISTTGKICSTAFIWIATLQDFFPQTQKLEPPCKYSITTTTTAKICSAAFIWMVTKCRIFSPIQTFKHCRNNMKSIIGAMQKYHMNVLLNEFHLNTSNHTLYNIINSD